MRILRHGSIYDSVLREILIKKHVCIRTSFPKRVKKALIKRKYENMLREKGLLKFRIISPEAMDYAEYAKIAHELTYELNQLTKEQKFILEVTLVDESPEPFEAREEAA